MNQVIRKQYLFYWLSIPILLTLLSVRFGMAYDVFLFEKSFIVGCYEVAIIMSVILFLIGLGYLYLDVKKVESTTKSFVFAIASFVATIFLTLYIRENGLTSSAWLYTSENGVTTDHGLLNHFNIIALGGLLIWVIVELLVLFRVVKKGRA